jgi:AraC family transcriptional regulator of adaptative response/methylated-DNA-[protein]-cysteine methyltransferase
VGGLAGLSKIRVDADGRRSHIRAIPIDIQRGRAIVTRSEKSDYVRIASAIEFINANTASQPRLSEVAAAVHMSKFHFQRMFCRWAGVTPKHYLQTLTVERAKQLLGEARPQLEISASLGLSSGSRLHDHFITVEGVTPGQYENKGDGLSISYGVHSTRFGAVFIASTPRGVCRLAFIEPKEEKAQLLALQKWWPNAALSADFDSTLLIAESMFGVATACDRPLSLFVSGTNFQVNVWRALMRIPPGKVASYADVATAVGKPKAVRAVGSAIGANPIAYLIPCHRVIRQSGELGGYRWGQTRKHALHAWEAAVYE